MQQRNHQSQSQKTQRIKKVWICSPQVKDLDFEGLFGNIESVLETSQKLLKNLQNAVKDKEGKDQELGNDWALVMIVGKGKESDPTNASADFRSHHILKSQ